MENRVEINFLECLYGILKKGKRGRSQCKSIDWHIEISIYILLSGEMVHIDMDITGGE